MIYRIKYTKDNEWAAFIRPKQQIEITTIEEQTRYRLGFKQCWLIDIDQPNVVRAIHEAYPLFESYFMRQCINIQEIYLTQLEKDYRIESIETKLLNGQEAKLNGMRMWAKSNIVFIESPEDNEVGKQTSLHHLMDLSLIHI